MISEAPLSSVIPSKRATADVYQLRANRAGRRIGRGHLPPRPLVYRRVHSPQRCTPRLPSSPRSRRNEGCTQMRSDGLSGGKTSADRRQTCPMPATMRQLSGVINGAPTYAAANYTAYSPITASKRRGDMNVARMTGAKSARCVVPRQARRKNNMQTVLRRYPGVTSGAPTTADGRRLCPYTAMPRRRARRRRNQR